jgi:hypothetical protein
MFLTVFKSKDKGEIKKMYDLNALRHFFKGMFFFFNFLIHETRGSID